MAFLTGRILEKEDFFLVTFPSLIFKKSVYYNLQMGGESNLDLAE